jgi:DNA polymerase III alpha subunit
MQKNKFGEIILDQDDLCDLVMKNHDVRTMSGVKVQADIDLEQMIANLEDPGGLITWTFPTNSDISVTEFDSVQQTHWHMPQAYRTLDIAEHVLNLCQSDAELQRVGHELLMFQERNLFDLLRYLKYLVDTMREHQVIWGMGRGSSVASYVLYLLGVHRINSMFYDLDASEFLR